MSDSSRTITPSRKQIALELTAAMLASGEHVTGDPEIDAERAVQLLAHVERALQLQRRQRLQAT